MRSNDGRLPRRLRGVEFTGSTVNTMDVRFMFVQVSLSEDIKWIVEHRFWGKVDHLKE